jgi:Uma2 family endonuclease
MDEFLIMLLMGAGVGCVGGVAVPGLGTEVNMNQVATGPAVDLEPQPRRWTRAEFERLAELGLFTGQRAELFEGEIMVLSPQKPQHYTTTDVAADVLRHLFGPGFHVRMQGPIDLGPHSEPEPDVAVVSGTRADYATQHPRTAALLVEVSDTTLSSDRARKGSLYARAGIEDYWIINLVDRRLEIYRDPIADPSQPYGFRYSTVLTLSAPDTVTPLAAPAVHIAVADLLP